MTKLPPSLPLSPHGRRALAGLRGVAVISILFGTTIAVAGGWVLDAACLGLLHPVFWGTSPIPPEAGAHADFGIRALGSVIAGMAVGILAIANGPIRDGDARGVIWIAQMLGVWFVLDIVAAVPAFAWPSVVLNVVLLLAFVVPLTMLHLEFRASSATARSIET